MIKGQATAIDAKLGISADRRFFTLNGAPTFLYGISYYGALNITNPQFLTDDLNDMAVDGFNWLRVWAYWNVGGIDVSVTTPKGAIRQPYMDNLKTLLAECHKRGIVVDVTTSRGKLPDPFPTNFADHLNCLKTLAQELKSYRNVYFDVANERNVRDVRFVSLDEVRQIISAVKAIDPERLCTASSSGNLTETELRDHVTVGKCDFIAPHLDRNQDSAARTVPLVTDYIAWMAKYKCRAPIHLQEPFRRGYNPNYEPGCDDFYRDCTGAKVAEAAGWCFHNGNEDPPPYRCFLMNNARLYTQFDSIEQEVRAQLKRRLVTTNVNIRQYHAQYAEQLAHQIGRLSGDAWSASPALDRAGFLSFGPYIKTLPAGKHVVTWRLMSDTIIADTTDLLILDINMGSTVVKERRLKRQDFSAPNAWQEFSLDFTTTGPATVEFRTQWFPRSMVKLSGITLSILGTPIPNDAPQVDAGRSAIITLPNNQVQLRGSVSDDGRPNPPGKVTLTWSKQSGPGTVTFNNPRIIDPIATFSAPGEYVLRLSANDAELTTTDTVTISVLKEGTIQRLKTYQGEGLYHQTGRLAGDAWRVTINDPHDAFLAFGPYDASLPGGELRARFFLRVDNNTFDNAEICTIDVHDATAQKILAGPQTITRKQWAQANAFQSFELKFTNTVGHKLEFRVFYRWYAQLDLDKVEIWGLGQMPETVIEDPLTNSTSRGVVKGGVFTPEGYKIGDRNGPGVNYAYIMYETPFTRNIKVEFDAKGYIKGEPSIKDDNTFFIFVMHDAQPDTNWGDSKVWSKLPNFLYQIRKEGLYIKDGQPLASTDGISFKTGCAYKKQQFNDAGYDLERKSWNRGQCLVAHPLEWDLNTVYHWVITVENGHTEIWRNNQKLFSEDCSKAFAPDNRVLVFIGGNAYGKYSVKNVTYSNVKISQL